MNLQNEVMSTVNLAIMLHVRVCARPPTLVLHHSMLTMVSATAIIPNCTHTVCLHPHSSTCKCDAQLSSIVASVQGTLECLMCNRILLRLRRTRALNSGTSGIF